MFSVVVVVVVVECHQKYNWKCLRHEQQQRNSSNKCLSYENIGRKMAEYKYIVTFKHRLSSLHRNLTLFFLWNSCVCLYVICLWNRCERFFLFNRSCFFFSLLSYDAIFAHYSHSIRVYVCVWATSVYMLCVLYLRNPVECKLKTSSQVKIWNVYRIVRLIPIRANESID